MQILTFTSLFPNAADKTFGVFIYQRMAHVDKRAGNKVHVVAPVPYVPGWLKQTRWGTMARIPKVEQIGELTVYHPRYLQLHKQIHFDCIDAHYVYPDCFAAVMIGRRLGLPVVASARGTDINLFPSFRLVRPMIR